jgi:hypothetical protein
MLAACGLDLAGGDAPATPDAGSTTVVPDSSVTVADTSAPPVVEAGGDNDGQAPILSAQPEVIAKSLSQPRAITLGNSTLYVGLKNGMAFYDLPDATLATTDTNVANIRSISLSAATACYVTDSAIGEDGIRSLGPLNTGYDVVCANGRLAATLGSEVRSYDFSDFGNELIQTNGTAGGPLGITADDTSLFWADSKKGQIFTSPMNAKGTVLYDNMPGATSVVLDGTDLLFTTATAIMRGPKAGGTASMLIGNLTTPLSLAVDDTYVYWMEPANGTLKRTNKTTGKSALEIARGTTFTDLTYTHVIAVEGTYIYWIEPGDNTLSRIKKN